MSLVIGLFLLGVGLVALEVFVPGGIIGLFGFAAILGGVIVAYLEFGATGFWSAGSVAVVLTAAILLIEFLVLPKTRLGRRLFLFKSVEGASQAAPDSDGDLLGREGVALTELNPGGVVQLGDTKADAVSRSGYIERNEPVKVVGKDSFQLIVSKI